MKGIDTRVRLSLLGNWQLEIDGQVCTGPAYNKGRALLAYVVRLGRSQAREHLSALLWPNGGGHLRRVLSNLRAVLDLGDGRPSLQSSTGALYLSPAYPLWLDLTGFDEINPCYANATPTQCARCLRSMENQVALYRGEFMAGFSLPECEEFENWLHRERETQRRRMLTLMERLWQCYERNGRPDKAVVFAARYVDLEPWNETGQRNLMRLLAVNGQTAAALSQFETCRSVLTRELGVGPERETLALYERIRSGAIDFAGLVPQSNRQASLIGASSNWG